jgi:glycosyltransferase involved in cell wall biosynthesis
MDASVIIPTFNREKFLRPTLQRLIQQEHNGLRYEIVVVDSGIDDTEQYVSSLKSGSQVPIRYKKIANSKNRSNLRNTGAALAVGKVLIFLDNDMLVCPDFVQKHFLKHKIGESNIYMGVRRSLIRFEMNPFLMSLLINDFNNMASLPYYDDVRLESVGPDLSLPVGWKYLFSHNFSVKKDVFEDAGGFAIDFGEKWGFEDVELGYRLALKGSQFFIDNQIILYHQPHIEQSIVDQNNYSDNAINFFTKHKNVNNELLVFSFKRHGQYTQHIQNLVDAKTPISIQIPKIRDNYDYILASIQYSSEESQQHLSILIPLAAPARCLPINEGSQQC